MTSQHGEQTIAVDMLLNISRNKGIQTINFVQLIKYNFSRKTFFLKNHTQNVVEKLFPGAFLKHQNQNYYMSK